MKRDHKAAVEKRDVNDIALENLRAILGPRSPEDYCGKPGDRDRLMYVTGSKMGKAVAPRTLRYALEGTHSPRLDLIAAVAFKEGLQTYQLIVPDLDPRNAPVMITKEHQNLLDRIKSDVKELDRR